MHLALAEATIRPLLPQDLPHVGRIIDETDMFPSSLLEDMTAPFFATHEPDDSSGHWHVIEHDDRAVAVAYFTAEPMASNVWNLLLIAVLPDYQHLGLGSELIEHVEATLRATSARVLLVETSGTPHFELTREFYRQHHYDEEARIRDYYDVGDDKVVFWKSLVARP